ncbi:MAG: hypothetical protein HYS13_08025 [Planctomycetia bacterium]|nr:hypothetical protein [Planctomycetia bacterium]
MTTKTVSPYLERIQKYANQYLEETGQERVTTKEVAVWLVRTKRWEPPADLVIEKCRQDVSRAFREEYISDDRGRSVRVKHAARITEGPIQKVWWSDIRRAPREHMELAFRQRREQIVGECRQLKRDMDFFNVLHEDDPIQLMFDFTDDIEEGDFPGEYPPKNPR